MDCIVCKKALENTGPDPREENQPSGGTAFQSRGHYGSTVFDPMDGTYLEINICDPCLVAAGDAGNVMMGFPQPSPPRGPMVNWRPADELAHRESLEPIFAAQSEYFAELRRRDGLRPDDKNGP